MQGMAKPPVTAVLPAHAGCASGCWSSAGKTGLSRACLQIWGFRKPGREVDGEWCLRRAVVGRNAWIQALGSSPEVCAGVNLVQ